MQLSSVDLNMLLPLRALLEERSVSRAATRLQLSQPALSGALARLRRHFGDELLERRGNAYFLTPLGEILLERVSVAEPSLERVFLARTEQVPVDLDREFRIMSSDYAVALFGGSLSATLSDLAPQVRVRYLNITPDFAADPIPVLRSLDGVLMPHGIIDGVPRLDLFTDRWVALVAEGNRVVGEALTREQLPQIGWVSAYAGQRRFTPVARQMQLLGIEPRVEVAADGFLVIPFLLAGTDRVALVQASLAERMVVAGGLRIVELPFDAPPLVESFWWARLHDADTEHTWFRGVLRQAALRSGLDTGNGQPA